MNAGSKNRSGLNYKASNEYTLLSRCEDESKNQAVYDCDVYVADVAYCMSKNEGIISPRTS